VDAAEQEKPNMTFASSVVLVADDEPDIRAVLAEMFEEVLGVCAAVAADGAEALDRIWICRPRLMILDWMMPRLDGPAVCRTLRQQPPSWPLTVVAISAAPVRDLALDAGCAAFVPKPFDMNDLLGIARRCIGV
jgi:CheY-like chemotaxis protein